MLAYGWQSIMSHHKSGQWLRVEKQYPNITGELCRCLQATIRGDTGRHCCQPLDHNFPIYLAHGTTDLVEHQLTRQAPLLGHPKAGRANEPHFQQCNRLQRATFSFSNCSLLFDLILETLTFECLRHMSYIVCTLLAEGFTSATSSQASSVHFRGDA